MAQRSHYELDLLRRFLPAPYLFNLPGGNTPVFIESNDLEIALALRSRQLAQPNSSVLHWSIMRDHKTSKGTAEITMVNNDDLRTLFVGNETILFFDRIQRKVLGFVGRLEIEHVISTLIPLLLDE